MNAADEVPRLPTVGPGAVLYPDRLEVVDGPATLDPAALAAVGPRLLGAGGRTALPAPTRRRRTRSAQVRADPQGRAVSAVGSRMSIAAARRDDLPAVMGLELAGFAPSEQWSERSWQGELLGDGRTTLLARMHVPVGVIALQTVGDVADLHRLVVSPRAPAAGRSVRRWSSPVWRRSGTPARAR